MTPIKEPTMSHLPPVGPPPLPTPLTWALSVCLVVLALIALLAVATLAGLSPADLITLMKQVGELATTLRP
jgi:hypothetical protein